jgi:hypothetical protein
MEGLGFRFQAEANLHKLLQHEMNQLPDWLNADQHLDVLLKAAVASLLSLSIPSMAEMYIACY